MATVDDFRWLMSNEGADWLAEVRDRWDPGRAQLNCLRWLRSRLDSDRARLIVETLELRRKGAIKFSRADRMLFTRRGLEQASSERLAEYKARRFPIGQPLTDYCCGIGGDLIGLAGRGPAEAVDRDVLALLLARHNAKVYDHDVDGRSVDFDQHRPPTGGLWHADPDRRSGGNRFSSVDRFSPSMDRLVERLRAFPNAAIKVAPATAAPAIADLPLEREFLGEGRECKQQVIWTGTLARQPSAVAATVVDRRDGSFESIQLLSEAPPPIAAAGRPLRYLVEPHAAVLTAGLELELARRDALQPLAEGHVWLTGDQPSHGLLARSFEQIDCCVARKREVSAMLERHAFDRLEIKSRGLRPKEVAAITGQSSHGHAPAVLLVTRIQQRRVAVLARRSD